MTKLTSLIILTVFFENCLCTLKPCNYSGDKHNISEYNEIGPPIIYHDVESVLKVLEKTEYKSLNVIQDLLNYYYEAKEKKAKFDLSGGSKRYPLIVIDGISGSGKTTITSILAKKVNGTQYHSPTKTLKYIRASIRNDSVLDTCYYSLGHYISSLEVSQLLKDSPVIMDRFWHSSGAFGIAYAVNNFPEKYSMPPKENKVYKWPEDLIKPDLGFLLDVTESVRIGRIMQRNQLEQIISPVFSSPTGTGKFINTCPSFRNNLLQAYKNIRDPSLIVVNADKTISEVLEEIYSKVQPIFPNVNFKN